MNSFVCPFCSRPLQEGVCDNPKCVAQGLPMEVSRETLLSLLSHEDDFVRRLGANVVANINDVSAMRALRDVFITEENPRVLQAIIQGLPPGEIEVITTMLNIVENIVGVEKRIAAISYLGNSTYHNQSVVPGKLISWASDDSEPTAVRRGAIQALKRIALLRIKHNVFPWQFFEIAVAEEQEIINALGRIAKAEIVEMQWDALETLGAFGAAPHAGDEVASLARRILINAYLYDEFAHRQTNLVLRSAISRASAQVSSKLIDGESLIFLDDKNMELMLSFLKEFTLLAWDSPKRADVNNGLSLLADLAKEQPAAKEAAMRHIVNNFMLIPERRTAGTVSAFCLLLGI